MKMRFTIGLILFGLISAISARAAVSIIPKSPVNTTSASISNLTNVLNCKDSQNGLYVAGGITVPTNGKYLPTVRVTKLNGANMQTVWVKDFALSQTYNSTYATKMLCKNGKVFVIGSFTEGPVQPMAGPSYTYDSDAFMVKLDGNNGNILTTTKHKPVNPDINPTNKISDMASLIEVDSQDNAYIAGNTGTLRISSSQLWGYSKWFVTKINSSGIVEWSQNIQGPYIDSDPLWARNAPLGIALNNAQTSLIVSGLVAEDDGITGSHLVKFATANGNIEAQANFYSYNSMQQLQTGDGLVLDTQDNVYFGARGGDYEQQTAATFVTKLDSALNHQWSQIFPTPEVQSSGDMNFISIDKSGNIVASGHVMSHRIITARLNPATGAVLYSKEIVDPAFAPLKLASQQIDSANNVKLLFSGSLISGNNSDVFLTGFTPSGTRYATLGYNMAAGYYDYAISSEQLSTDEIVMVTASGASVAMPRGAQLNRVKLTASIPTPIKASLLSSK